MNEARQVAEKIKDKGPAEALRPAAQILDEAATAADDKKEGLFRIALAIVGMVHHGMDGALLSTTLTRR